MKRRSLVIFFLAIMHPALLQSMSTNSSFCILSSNTMDVQKAIKAVGLLSGMIIFNEAFRAHQNSQPVSIKALAAKYEHVDAPFAWYGSTGDRLLIGFYQGLQDDLISAKKAKKRASGDDKTEFKKLIATMTRLQKKLNPMYEMAYARQRCARFNYGLR